MELIIQEVNLSPPTICLNMIVKNESKIITRLFDSVLPIIDCYCICDTGSTDNTLELINDYFQNKNIPGKVVHEKFINFAHNRNVALKSCVGMSDYVLLLDADMILETHDFNKNDIFGYDTIYLLQGTPEFFYRNVRIVKNNSVHKYVGVTHEYLDYPDNFRVLDISRSKLFINDVGDGGSKSDKYERDIALLSNDIKETPQNARSHFYLANSYHDSKKYSEAINYYRKRIELGGWKQEVWYSYYRIGLCCLKMDKPEEAISAWLDGYNFLPKRLEGLYEVIKYYRLNSKNNIGLEFCKIAFNILDENYPRENFLFLHNHVYAYNIYYEYSIIAYYNKIKNINNEIVKILNNCDDHVICESLLQNMKFYKFILKKKNTFDFTDKITKQINDKNVEFYSSSSCLIKKHDKYFMNVRYVNYYITENSEYINYGDNIISINKFVEFTGESKDNDNDGNNDSNIINVNKFVELNSDFKVKDSKMFYLNFDDRQYIGVEDVRIFNDVETNKIIFIGTSFHLNNNIGIVTGEYNSNKRDLISKEIKSSFSDEYCEKNWVFVDYNNSTHVIYKWHPLQICKIDSKTNLLNKVETKNMPLIFSHCRGSTCGFTFKNKEIWFVVHIVSYEIPRNYYHMLVVFDDKMNLKSYSAPFKFEGEPIEYCLGLIVEKNRVVMNYSTWDRTTKIAVYDKEYIDSLLIYN